jgi:hypothetical protein
MANLSRDSAAAYFSSLEMGESLVEKSLNLFGEYGNYLSEPIEHVFVSEYRNEDGNRIYESIWFLTNSFLAEAHEITGTGYGDIVPVGAGFIRIQFSRENFDLEKAEDQARFTTEIRLEKGELAGTFKASGKNCEHLLAILHQYMLPRLR